MPPPKPFASCYISDSSGGSVSLPQNASLPASVSVSVSLPLPPLSFTSVPVCGHSWRQNVCKLYVLRAHIFVLAGAMETQYEWHIIMCLSDTWFCYLLVRRRLSVSGQKWVFLWKLWVSLPGLSVLLCLGGLRLHGSSYWFILFLAPPSLFRRWFSIQKNQLVYQKKFKVGKAGWTVLCMQTYTTQVHTRLIPPPAPPGPAHGGGGRPAAVYGEAMSGPRAPVLFWGRFPLQVSWAQLVRCRV